MIRLILLSSLFLHSIGAFSTGSPFTSAAGGGNWNAGATWGNAGNTAGVDYPIAGQTATISAASTVTVPSGTFAVGNLIMTSSNTAILNINGVLEVNGAISWTASITRAFLNVNASGIIRLKDGSTVQAGGLPRFIIASAGIFEMNYSSGGTVPNITFNSGSILRFTGFTSGSAVAPGFEVGVILQNVEWNCPSQGNDVAFNGTIPSIGGYLSILSTGPDPWYFIFTSSAASTLSVAGDFTISGGGYAILSDGAGTFTLTVNGNVLISGAGSELDMKQSTGVGTLYAKHNLTLTSGILETFGAGASSIIFDGNVTHQFTNTGGTIGGATGFTVASPSVLDLGTSSLTGTGSFNLNSGATVRVGSTDGSGAIQNAPALAGNIQLSGVRTYSNNSNIIYSGTSTQQLGNGFPSNVNLVIQNTGTSPNNRVFNNNVGVTNVIGTLTLSQGALYIGNSNTLNIQSTFIATAGGFIGGDLTSNLIFSGSGTADILNFDAGSEFLNNLTISRTTDIVLGSKLTVGGSSPSNISLTNGNLDISGVTLTMNGNLIGGGKGLISSSGSTLIFGGSVYNGGIPFSGSGNQLLNLTFSTPGGIFTWNSAVLINGTMTVNAGSVSHTSGITMSGNSTIVMSGGSFTNAAPAATSSYNVTYLASNSTGVELPTSTTALKDLTISASGTVALSSDITVNGILNLTSGTFNAGSHALDLKGNFTSNGNSTLTSSAITFSGSTGVTGGISPVFGAITVTGSLTPSSNFQVNGNLNNSGTLNASSGTTTFGGTTTISGTGTTSLNNVTVSGTLIAPASTTLNIAGNFTNNGNFNHNNGTVAFTGNTSILGADTTNFFHVNINGTLKASATMFLGIAGNLTNAGTFNNNGGTVHFNGTVSSQTISGSALTFNNIKVSNPITPGVNVNSAVRLDGTLTLATGGYFDADGTGSGVFTISSSSQIAGGRIATLPDPTKFVGNVTVERYIQGKTGGDFRYLSMPITNGNVSMLKSSIFVTGSYSDHNTHADNANIQDSGNTNPSVFSFNGTAYVGLSGATTTATPLDNKVGYSAYDFNDGPVTASYRGTIGKGDVNVTISSTLNTFNLIPNPYPSPIDWDNVAKVNVNNAMYLRSATNVYSTYILNSGANKPFPTWSGEVATGQSFFTTSAGGSTTFTLHEAAKTGNSFYFLRQMAPINYFRIQLASAAGQQDETVIRFIDAATDSVDSEFDAPKLKNGNSMLPIPEKTDYLNLSTYLDAQAGDLAINSLGILKGPKIVWLSVTEVSPGNHSLNFSELSEMTLGYKIVLVDNYLNKETEVKDSLSYNFTVDKNVSSYGRSRFFLRINGDAVVTGLEPLFNDFKAYPNPTNDKLFIELSPEQESKLRAISLYDMLGRSVVNSESDRQLLEPGRRSIDMSNLSTGVYVLNIKFGDKDKSIRVIRK